jgi:hypothetical protein
MIDFRRLRGFAKQRARRAPKADPADLDRTRRQRDYAETVTFLSSAAGERAASRGTASPSDTARLIIDAAALARRGGPARRAPTGLAAEILAAGEKRRRPFGD